MKIAEKLSIPKDILECIRTIEVCLGTIKAFCAILSGGEDEAQPNIDKSGRNIDSIPAGFVKVADFIKRFGFFSVPAFTKALQDNRVSFRMAYCKRKGKYYVDESTLIRYLAKQITAKGSRFRHSYEFAVQNIPEFALAVKKAHSEAVFDKTASNLPENFGEIE
jgi:hypothetical protein